MSMSSRGRRESGPPDRPVPKGRLNFTQDPFLGPTPKKARSKPPPTSSSHTGPENTQSHSESSATSPPPGSPERPPFPRNSLPQYQPSQSQPYPAQSPAIYSPCPK